MMTAEQLLTALDDVLMPPFANNIDSSIDTYHRLISINENRFTKVMYPLLWDSRPLTFKSAESWLKFKTADIYW